MWTLRQGQPGAQQNDWRSIVDAALDKVREMDARLLIVDTLPGLARLQGEGENSSGHALAALRPLQEADAPGLAKLARQPKTPYVYRAN